jgi:hypothetical protein
MHPDIKAYNNAQTSEDKEICTQLADIIIKSIPEAENKIWHGHPVWFLDGNPIVGYSKRKKGLQLMFWSGASFDEDELQLGSGKFKDASKTYTSVEEINVIDVARWIEKSKQIQWDYKNIVKRKGILERLK